MHACARALGRSPSPWKRALGCTVPHPHEFGDYFAFNLHLSFLPVLGSSSAAVAAPAYQPGNDTGRVRVVYTGVGIGGNRGVVATAPLPGPHHASRFPCFSIFKCSTPTPSAGVRTVTGRQLVAYFEVTVQAPLPKFTKLHSEDPGCVAVGIATQRFPLGCRMPGWDRHSCELDVAWVGLGGCG